MESIHNKSYDEEGVISNILQTYFELFYRTLKDKEIKKNLNSILLENENTLFYKKFLEQKLHLYKVFELEIKDYKIDLIYKSFKIKEAKAEIVLELNADYSYIDTDLKSILRNISYNIELVKKDNRWLISNMDTDLDEYMDLKQRYETEQKGKADKFSIDEFFQEMNEDISMLKSRMAKHIARTESPYIEREKPYAFGGYNYFPSNGISYAKKYVNYGQGVPRLFYRASGRDCTNFVSQCVWAAYGGWVPGNDYLTQQNINKMVRMVPNIWHGGIGGGTPQWESVMDFFSYVTYVKQHNKKYGPKASAYGGTTAYSISPYTFSPGNVLQFRRGPGGDYRDYSHSVYVIFNRYDGTYGGVYICQHTDDQLKPLIEVIKRNGGTECYIRGLSFVSADFQS